MAIDELRQETYRVPRTFARFATMSYHPEFIDYNQRHSLLVANPPDPKNNLHPYFFARKVDSSSQNRLKKWIDLKLRNPDPLAPCDIEDISYKSKCFAEALQNLSSVPASPTHGLHNHNVELGQDRNQDHLQFNSIPILVPVNYASRLLDMNLACSLPRKKEIFSLPNS